MGFLKSERICVTDDNLGSPLASARLSDGPQLAAGHWTQKPGPAERQNTLSFLEAVRSCAPNALESLFL